MFMWAAKVVEQVIEGGKAPVMISRKLGKGKALIMEVSRDHWSAESQGSKEDMRIERM
jgi:hypothetical protein